MSTTPYLPPEIIINILSYEIIDIYDVKNFLSTCDQWYYANEFNSLWRKKFFQRWPSFKNIYKDHVRNMEDINFKVEAEASIECRKKLWCYLSQMTRKHYHRAGLPDGDIKDFELLFDREKHPMNIYFLLNELRHMTEPYGRQFNELDATQKYYATKLASYLKRYQQRYKWQRFKNSTDQTLERAATLMAQCWQPEKYITYTYVDKSLDDISQQVLEHLRKEYPTHSIFSFSPEDLSSLKHNDIDNILWNTEESQQIMNCIEDILQMFDKKVQHNYNWNFIDYTLKTKCGNVINISVIFASVAKRLGISCNIVLLDPSRCYLTWKSKELAATDTTYNKCFYFNITKRERQKGSYRKYLTCYFKSYKNAEMDCTMMVARTIEPLIKELKMTSKLSKSEHYSRAFLEFFQLVEPDVYNLQYLADNYYKDIDLSYLVTELENMQGSRYNNDKEEKKIKELLDKYRALYEILAEAETYFRGTMPKRRTRPIKFLIGEIVEFLEHGKSSRKGVITGWDIYYNPYVVLEKTDSNWRTTISRNFKGNIDLPGPFYTIYSENETHYIVEVQIMDVIKPHSITFSGIHCSFENPLRKYFCAVKKTYCIPNEMLAYYYPDDFEMLRAKYNF